MYTVGGGVTETHMHMHAQPVYAPVRAYKLHFSYVYIYSHVGTCCTSRSVHGISCANTRAPARA